MATDENPDGFYPSPYESTITYATKTFSTTYLGNPYKTCKYNISNDSLLIHDNEIDGKISQINDSILIITFPHGYGASRYGKINNN